MAGFRDASHTLMKSVQSFGRLMQWVTFTSLSKERSVSASPPVSDSLSSLRSASVVLRSSPSLLHTASWRDLDSREAVPRPLGFRWFCWTRLQGHQKQCKTTWWRHEGHTQGLAVIVAPGPRRTKVVFQCECGGTAQRRGSRGRKESVSWRRLRRQEGNSTSVPRVEGDMLVGSEDITGTLGLSYQRRRRANASAGVEATTHCVTHDVFETCARECAHSLFSVPEQPPVCEGDVRRKWGLPTCVRAVYDVCCLWPPEIIYKISLLSVRMVVISIPPLSSENMALGVLIETCLFYIGNITFALSGSG